MTTDAWRSHADAMTTSIGELVVTSRNLYESMTSNTQYHRIASFKFCREVEPMRNVDFVNQEIAAIRMQCHVSLGLHIRIDSPHYSPLWDWGLSVGLHLLRVCFHVNIHYSNVNSPSFYQGLDPVKL